MQRCRDRIAKNLEIARKEIEWKVRRLLTTALRQTRERAPRRPCNATPKCRSSKSPSPCWRTPSSPPPRSSRSPPSPQPWPPCHQSMQPAQPTTWTPSPRPRTPLSLLHTHNPTAIPLLVTKPPSTQEFHTAHEFRADTEPFPPIRGSLQSGGAPLHRSHHPSCRLPLPSSPPGTQPSALRPGCERKESPQEWFPPERALVTYCDAASPRMVHHHRHHHHHGARIPIIIAMDDSSSPSWSPPPRPLWRLAMQAPAVNEWPSRLCICRADRFRWVVPHGAPSRPGRSRSWCDQSRHRASRWPPPDCLPDSVPTLRPGSCCSFPFPSLQVATWLCAASLQPFWEARALNRPWRQTRHCLRLLEISGSWCTERVDEVGCGQGDGVGCGSQHACRGRTGRIHEEECIPKTVIFPQKPPLSSIAVHFSAWVNVSIPIQWRAVTIPCIYVTCSFRALECIFSKENVVFLGIVMVLRVYARRHQEHCTSKLSYVRILPVVLLQPFQDPHPRPSLSHKGDIIYREGTFSSWHLWGFYENGNFQYKDGTQNHLKFYPLYWN